MEIAERDRDRTASPKKHGRRLAEHSLDKTSVSVRIPLELCLKVERRFADERGAKADSYVRALAESVKGIQLTKRDIEAVEAAKRENLAKRMRQRERRRREGGK